MMRDFISFCRNTFSIIITLSISDKHQTQLELLYFLKTFQETIECNPSIGVPQRSSSSRRCGDRVGGSYRVMIVVALLVTVSLLSVVALLVKVALLSGGGIVGESGIAIRGWHCW